MHRTLFYLPEQALGMPLFGVGLLLAVWAVGTAVFLASLLRRQGLSGDTLSYALTLAGVGAVILFVLPAISEPGHGIPIRGYGALLLAAVVAGVGLALYRAHQMAVNPEVIISLAFWLFVAGIIGARLFYVIEYWPQFSSGSFRDLLVKVISINQGGLVVFGSLLGGIAAFIAFVIRYRLPALALADLVAPSLALGQAIGRVGCFMNGCCYGGVTDAPWAVQFPHDSPPRYEQGANGQVYGLLVAAASAGDQAPIVAWVEPGGPAEMAGINALDRVIAVDGRNVATVKEAHRAIAESSAAGEPLRLKTSTGERELPLIDGPGGPSRPIHPTQLYSAIDGFLLCFVLLAYAPFQRRDGELIALALTIHPITRFLLEIIRTDEGPVFGTGLSISQNVGLLLLAGAAVLWTYILMQPKQRTWLNERPTPAPA